jgi:hypothetical protein
LISKINLDIFFQILVNLFKFTLEIKYFPNFSQSFCQKKKNTGPYDISTLYHIGLGCLRGFILGVVDEPSWVHVGFHHGNLFFKG